MQLAGKGNELPLALLLPTQSGHRKGRQKARAVSYAIAFFQLLAALRANFDHYE
jgi:hypothetical protein